MKKLRKRNISEESAILYKRTGPEKVLYGFVFVVFLIYALSLILPFVWLFINSLQDKTVYEMNLVLNKPFAFPKKLDWSNYAYAFQKLTYNDTNIFGMFFNSIWYTLVRIFGGVLASALTGYALAKYEFKGRNVIFAIIVFSMTVPIVGTTGATFKLVNDVLHIYNTPFYPILKYFSGIGMNFLVMYGFFKNISWSYAEAAFIDGASHSKVFFSVMLPQATSAVITLSILTGITAWNEYMDVLLYLPNFPTIASGLYGVSRTLPREGYSTAYFAALVISLIPVLITFCCFSDVIMKNFAVGGLKG